MLPDDLDDVEERMDEAEVLEYVREARGEEFVEEHRELILLDARRMGMI